MSPASPGTKIKCQSGIQVFGRDSDAVNRGGITLSFGEGNARD